MDNLIDLVDAYGLDGVDIDWEFPDPADGENYTALMRELAEDLGSRGKLLTAAVAAEGWNGEGVQRAVFGYVDFISIMSYEGGSPDASFAYAVSNLNYWQGRGLSTAKTVLGVPFFAQTGYLSYRDLVAMDLENAYQDCVAVGDAQACYNGIPTIQQKTDLLLRRGVGMMFWESSMDTSDDTSLVSAIAARALGL